jgi:hypothetical protein
MVAREEQAMTLFDQRENAYEAEFAHREEVRFKVRERAVRMLALWAAERLGKSGQASEAYARDIVAMDVASSKPDVAFGRIVEDLGARGFSVLEVRQARDRLLAQVDASIRGATSELTQAGGPTNARR